jgi:hypothetical protein
MKLEPFALSKEQEFGSEFEIIFLHNEKKIQYGFECTSAEVLNEWLLIDDKVVFERTGQSISYGNKYKTMLAAYKKVPSERLYVAVLDYFLDERTEKTVIGDLVEFLVNEYNVYAEFLSEFTVKGLGTEIRISKKLVSNTEYLKKVEAYLRLADIGIKRLDVQMKDVMDEQTGRKYKKKILNTVHDVYDKNGNVIGEKLFDLTQESSGTIRFLAYIQNMIEMITRGGVFIIDEMSARFHPLLSKLIVDIFNSEPNAKGQLIFTTHDISLLNHDQFRRDEVVFVDKNERGESTLYALSDLKVREDATFSKDYLQGKYGAIPIFQYDEIKEDISNEQNTIRAAT